MQDLELLAPARNKDIGIAAIDCGADAVYIAGPDFGARKAAGNSFEDIAELCDYAHLFGARVFVTFNTVIFDSELQHAHKQMLRAQAAGTDAFIIRDIRITGWEDIKIPLHASTQCAIRDVERAKKYESLGCSRIILERELSISTIRKICEAVNCEVEFFVHGALCVCYSGDCRLSEYIDGRSADRGECIQACRSLYDLVDGSGKVLLHNKAILSLKDYNLESRLENLAEAGICSFKVEGRLKNESYVRNVVREYDLALNTLVSKYPDRYRRASFGYVRGGFAPDVNKTFNRGYTQLYIDGKRDRWSSMDTPKSMGEAIGKVGSIRRKDKTMELTVIPLDKEISLHNGDGFSFSTHDGITGFRGDVCDGWHISCKDIPNLREGMNLFRNINALFEKEIATKLCHREIPVSLSVKIHGKYVIDISAHSQDGRECTSSFNTDVDTAENKERAEAMLREQLSKRSGNFNFSLDNLDIFTSEARLPLLSAATINSMRRLVAEDISNMPCKRRKLARGVRSDTCTDFLQKPACPDELMRTRYCVRFELGFCPVHQGAKAPQRLFLLNNKKRLELVFDCQNCEMTVKEVQK